MRVLLAFEEEYRVYMEAMAAALRTFRSDVEVAVTNGRSLEAKVERFDPHLLISAPPIPVNPIEEGIVARIELSPEPDQPSRCRVGERHWETTNPTLGEILRVVDETKRLRRAAREQDPSDAEEEQG